MTLTDQAEGRKSKPPREQMVRLFRHQELDLYARTRRNRANVRVVEAPIIEVLSERLRRQYRTNRIKLSEAMEKQLVFNLIVTKDIHYRRNLEQETIDNNRILPEKKDDGIEDRVQVMELKVQAATQRSVGSRDCQVDHLHYLCIQRSSKDIGRRVV